VFWMGFRNPYVWKMPHFISGCRAIGIAGFVSHTVSCYLLLYHCTVLLNGQMYIEICLWREDGKMKILRFSFYPVGPE
jgi:hypothetical protein